MCIRDRAVLELEPSRRAMSDRKRRRPPDSGRNQRSRYKLQSPLSILPSLFTIGNIFCAYYSVMSTLNQKYDHAALAIGVGYILDGLDGRVARLTGTSTEFGAQLDLSLIHISEPTRLL